MTTFDLHRMQLALAGKSFLMPVGLNREEKRAYILACSGWVDTTTSR